MIIRSIERTDCRKGGFTCGEPTLDAYLARHAYGNELGGIARTYVLVEAEEPDVILGFYTLSASKLSPDTLAPVLGSTLPRYDLPVSYIGMFAVATDRQGAGLGTDLMLDAMTRSLVGAQTVGSTGIFLHSRDQKSTRFYTKLGFTSLTDETSHRPMFLPMSTVIAVVSAAPRGELGTRA